MPLLRKQPFVRVKPPPNIKPTDEVFYCEITKEIFLDYDDFFQRTILCNSLVWSCAVTGKSNLTFEEALESEEKAKKRIGSMPKALKKAILWLASHTKRGRLGEVTDDVYEYTKNRFFKGEVVEAIVNDQWVDAKVVSVIAPTDEEIAAAEDDDDEITEVDKDGSPKKDKEKDKGPKFSPADQLFKYELEEVEPDDEDMVELHTIAAEDIKREKGTYTREKLNVYLKNVLELEGIQWQVKPAGIKLYQLENMPFTDLFAGPEPVFEESQRKAPVMNKNKKGQFTLDGWVKGDKPAKPEKASKPEKPKEPVIKQKKQTPEEIEAEMKRLREAQERYREEMKRKAEEAKKRRIEEKAREREKKKEEKKLVTELLSEWSRKRDDLECEDLKELPKPDPVRCHVPNHLFGEFASILEFHNSFSDILELKDSYPGGMTFDELESSLAEKESPDGALFDILSFMLVTLFDLQLEEEEEAKCSSDKTLDQLDKNVLGKDEEIASAIKTATELAAYTKNNLGLTLREVHLDQWSLTEVLRIHLESSGAFKGHNLQNWRYQQRGGYRLSDDPGFQFCRDHPEILSSLQSQTIYELSIDDKLKIMSCLMNQMLTYAGVRDEIDTRMETKIEAERELKEANEQERKRIREMEEEERKKRREENEKRKEEIEKRREEIKKKTEERLKEAEAGTGENGEQKPAAAAIPPEALMTDRQREALKTNQEAKEREKQRKEELKRSEYHDRETALQEALLEAQRQVYVHCLGRDRAYRRFWTFESISGIFVEHDDDNIGGCLSEATPWDPEAGPISEEEAQQRAKEIMAQIDAEGKAPDEEMKVSEVVKTYGRKTSQLKQKTLATVNGNVGIASETKSEIKEEDVKPEVKVNGDSSATPMDTSESTNGQENGHAEDEKEKIPTEPPWGRCEANEDNCPVHSTILPRTHWSYYHTVSHLDSLIDSLNPRGIREGDLRDKLIAEREVLERKLKKSSDHSLLSKDEEALASDDAKSLDDVVKRREKVAKSSGGVALPLGTKLHDCMELALRDQILEVEEKLYLGSLGKLHVKDRLVWQNAIQTREYDMCCEELTWGTPKEAGEENKNRLTPEMLADSEGNGSADDKRDSVGSNAGWNTTVKRLAAAILQVGKMINDPEQILKHPLGEDEKDRKRRQKEEEKKRKEREQEEEDGVVCEDDGKDGSDTPLTPFMRWQSSLMASTNLGQLFIHLTALDTSVVWSKSILNTKCRICRRKTDPDKMLLCDGCDRGHHLYCLKPKLKNVPKGEWFCADCKPKQRIRSPKKNVRRVFSTTEDDTTEDDDFDDNTAKEESAAEDTGDEDNESEDEAPVASKKKGNLKDKKKKGGAVKKLDMSAKKGAASNKNQKKGSLANLLGKRRAAASQGEEKRKQKEAESEEDDEDEEDEEEEENEEEEEMEDEEYEEEETTTSRSRSSKKSGKKETAANNSLSKESRNSRSSRKAKEEENKENSGKSKRRRGQLDDDIVLQFNVSGLEDLLKGMMAHKDGWPFDRPITKSDAPDYHKIIAKPMDLCTIRSRLNSLKYSCNQEVLDDIRLVFQNCYQYNMEDAEEYQCGQRLEKYFDREVKKMGLSEASADTTSTAKQTNGSKRSRRTL